MSKVVNKKNKRKHHKYPYVSVCTPTFNRRPFIESMIKCFQGQDYPKDRMEWIIIDDGTDKIGDLVKDVPRVKYFAYDTKMSLGEKRNIMHQKSCGGIIVYMDDDDYYPPQRVSHAVEKLKATPEALCAGSSEIYIYFKHIQKLYQFGPYGPNHATAGTFAFRRQLLNVTRYADWLLKNQIKIDNWASDTNYTKFLIDYLKLEDPLDAIARSIETTIALAKAEGIQSKDSLRYGNKNKLCYAITSGKISPWMLYQSDSGIQLIESLDVTQQKMILDYINPEQWAIKFKRSSNIIGQVKELLNAAGY